MADLYAQCLIPDWPAPAHVKAVFSTRRGGVSLRPYDSLNLADHVSDQPASVDANRVLIQQACGARAVFLKQIHGFEVLNIDNTTPNGIQADASLTVQHGVACAVMVADCLPLLLTSADGVAVAAAHVGWRGLVGDAANGHRGVVQAVVTALLTEAKISTPNHLMAWLGPCIGPSAFEVGADVKAVFQTAQPDCQDFFIPGAPGKFFADLAGLTRQVLFRLGMTRVYGNDGSDQWCTVRNPDKYFSHRRDAKHASNGLGPTGRMGAFIWKI